VNLFRFNFRRNWRDHRNIILGESRQPILRSSFNIFLLSIPEGILNIESFIKRLFKIRLGRILKRFIKLILRERGFSHCTKGNRCQAHSFLLRSICHHRKRRVALTGKKLCSFLEPTRGDRLKLEISSQFDFL
jgi:hypothetical protein